MAGTADDLGRWLEAEGLVSPVGPGAIADVDHVKTLLIAAARRREAVSYSALLSQLGCRFSRPKMRALCRTLDAIDRDGVVAGEPPLAVLVVRESDGLPGQGWWTGQAASGHGGPWHGPEAAAYVHTQQQRAFRYWRERTV